MKTLAVKSIEIDHPSIKECLILDIETDSLDIEQAKVKFLGAYSYKFEKYYIIDEDERDSMVWLIGEHKICIGFNNKEFDHPILQNNGFEMTYKICVDCMQVLYNYRMKKPNRKQIIELPDGRSLDAACSSNKLRDIAKTLGLGHEKGDIDYKLFQKPVKELTPQERKQVEYYLYKDIATTKELFEFYVKYFDNFREYVGDENIRKFNYIRSSLASYTYSAICHLAGLKEEYDDIPSKPFKGADVLDIAKKYAKDAIVFDFASLYPNSIIQNNLVTTVDKCGCESCKNGKYHSGNDSVNLKGKYCKTAQGKVEKVMEMILRKRLEYKKTKDPRQLALKIMLNSFYGLASSARFKSVYNPTLGEDTCTFGRACLHEAKSQFEAAGFTVLYGDTDSCFVELNGRSKDECIAIANNVIKTMQAFTPFPKDTWKMAVDNEIKKIWFFGKKNYTYITSKDKLVIKGLPIIKGNATEIGQQVLEIIKPKIIEQCSIKFPRKYFEDLIQDMVSKDVTLIGQLYNVRRPEDYSSNTSLYYQIAATPGFGEGIHLLIPNKRLGQIGKEKKYCTADEAKQLTINDLLLDKVWSELEPFIEEERILGQITPLATGQPKTYIF